MSKVFHWCYSLIFQSSVLFHQIFFLKLQSVVNYFVLCFLELTIGHFGTHELFDPILKLALDFVFELKFFTGCVKYLKSSADNCQFLDNFSDEYFLEMVVDFLVLELCLEDADFGQAVSKGTLNTSEFEGTVA